MSKKGVLKVKVVGEALAKALNIQPGTVVDVKTAGGVPVDRYWRNRLRDAEIRDGKGEAVDKSIEIPKTKTTTTTKSSKPAVSDDSQEV